jgi:hypothetical protein
MKTLMLAAATLTLAAPMLAACQQDPAQKALVQSCVADGLPEDTCKCLASESKKSMDPKVYEAIALAATGKVDEANAIMETLPIEKKFQAGSGIHGAMAACAVNAN